ncbi:MAG: glycosyltransferase [Fimbriimonadaceae bacterium]|nr:glycosyltransferase [Fimbriimonadaceae bacterium]
MRVAWVVPGGVDRGGVERVIPFQLWLMQRLSREVELHVWALRQEPEPGDWPLCGAQVHCLGDGSRAARLERFRESFEQHGPFDVLHAMWAGEPQLFPARAAAGPLPPTVVSLTGGEVACLPQIRYGGCCTWRGRLVTWRCLQRAAVVICWTDFIAHQARRYRRRLERLPLGCPTDLFTPAPAPPAAPPYRLLHVGSQNRVKDQGTLLRACAEVVRRGWDVRLDLFGCDILDGERPRQAAELGLADRVTFHPVIASADLAAHYRGAHLYVHSSLHEGACLALAEAAASGLPCVGTRVGYLHDWPPEVGLATPVGDPLALAEGICALLADPARRAAMGAAARQWAVAHNVDQTAAGLLRIYRSLV